MIVVVGGLKGGCGKTTLATNLAVLSALYEEKVLLVDADELLSSTHWMQQRMLEDELCRIDLMKLAGKEIYQDIIEIKKEKYSHIIIDVGGRDTTSQRSALVVADIFLIPFRPRSLDIWTIEALKKMIQDVRSVNPKLRVLTVLNQADARGKDNQEALDILKDVREFQCLPEVIGYRKAYGNASSFGLGVVEMVKKDRFAIAEMGYLYTCIYL